MRLVTDTFAYCRTELPAWNTISISGYHMREAGATAVQEVAFTVANAIAYADAALAAGMAFDEFAPRLSFFFAAHNDLLEEVAKFRAARRVWARVARERFGARDPKAMAMRFHVQTGGIDAHRPAAGRQRRADLRAGDGGDPGRGAVAAHQRARRGARAADAGVGPAGPANATGVVFGVGGHGHGRPARRLLLRRDPHQPDRGSGRWPRSRPIDERGGTLAALADGYQQDAIGDAAYEQQRAIEAGERVIVGVNAYAEEGVELAAGAAAHRSGARGEPGRADASPSRGPGPGGGRAAVADLERAAAGTENVLPRIRACVEAAVTLGEIANAMRRVWGEHRP